MFQGKNRLRFTGCNPHGHILSAIWKRDHKLAHSRSEIRLSWSKAETNIRKATPKNAVLTLEIINTNV